MIKIEVCCGSLQDVQIASQYPIDRIELNTALNVGGLTPSLALLRHSKEVTNIPLICMVRPRTGNFTYSESEISVMMSEAQMLLEHGADGLAFGFVTKDGTVDEVNTQVMIELCHQYAAEAVFHRAFDTLKDPITSLKVLHRLGCDRILTSGSQVSAIKGANLLKELFSLNLVTILAGGGINTQNVGDLVENTGVKEIHGSFSELVPPIPSSTIITFEDSHYPLSRTSHAKLRELITIIK